MTTDLKSMTVTADCLRDYLAYDPVTGVFRRKKITTNVVSVGEEVNSKNAEGYLRTKLLGKEYKLHRLAWLLHYGEWPKGEIDHINGIKDDNRICNLRDVSRIENELNKRCPRKDNVSGFTGVSVFGERFQSKIRINGKLVHLGTYKTAIEAKIAYDEKRKEIGRCL